MSARRSGPPRGRGRQGSITTHPARHRPCRTAGGAPCGVAPAPAGATCGIGRPVMASMLAMVSFSAATVRRITGSALPPAPSAASAHPRRIRTTRGAGTRTAARRPGSAGSPGAPPRTPPAAPPAPRAPRAAPPPRHRRAPRATCGSRPAPLVPPHPTFRRRCAPSPRAPLCAPPPAPAQRAGVPRRMQAVRRPLRSDATHQGARRWPSARCAGPRTGPHEGPRRPRRSRQSTAREPPGGSCATPAPPRRPARSAAPRGAA